MNRRPRRRLGRLRLCRPCFTSHLQLNQRRDEGEYYWTLGVEAISGDVVTSDARRIKRLSPVTLWVQTAGHANQIGH